MKIKILAFLAMFASAELLLTPSVAPAAAKSDAPISAKDAFDRLKSLAGEWRGTEGEKGKGPEVPVLYRTTSNGTVVMETLFPGTDHEMVTVYFLDGPKLVMTHYCSLGNQPKMALTSHSMADELDFVYAGGTNLKPKKDMHMHAMSIRFEGKDEISTVWELFQEGKKVDSKKFFFSRKA